MHNGLPTDKNINLSRTLLVTGLLSLGSVFAAFMIQNQANRSTGSCSYLDPIAIDIWATVFALFLILEGFLDILKYKNSSLKSQLTKSIRVSLGFAILTVHLMQFIHK
jgi:hypothetical protein